MEFAPNQTPIKATITELFNENKEVKIVIIELPSNGNYPGFLSVGKILTAKVLSHNTDYKLEDVISAEIEVSGGPFKQVYKLHHVSTNS
ncbi:hypothetical protein ACFFU1_06510 [Algibacter miyuki]|uniref:S1 motif domain-containing protein n=1 Tax=Algibacter miyuki TaxID=1306933 RepID=A0ABV5GZP0_9FLAO|nr:hypothetical protein [Algibacter miyuki]MDN3667261.1 hypothetical protein [Algibacter miyuki]